MAMRTSLTMTWRSCTMDYSNRRSTWAFTLIEILIVVTIIGIMAAVVVPLFGNVDVTAKSESMATVVRHTRELIAYRAAAGEGELSDQGFPVAVDPTWYPNNQLPYHGWTCQPMIVETVTGAADAVYPATKTYNSESAGAKNAWYNKTNGAFCLRIPAQGNDAETLAIFNEVNISDATALNQTKY